MPFHHLSRPAKRALVLLLSIAIILPLLALLPRYLAWKERQAYQRALDDGAYTASVTDTLSR